MMTKVTDRSIISDYYVISDYYTLYTTLKRHKHTPKIWIIMYQIKIF